MSGPSLHFPAHVLGLKSIDMSAAPPPAVQVILGAMEFGHTATEQLSQTILQSFLAASHREVDTARVYADGKSEQIIGRLPAAIKSQITLHTKVNPLLNEAGFTPDGITQQANASLEALQLQPSPANPPIDILYLHRPDPNNPIEPTLQAMNELHVRGVYRRLGLSNYPAWQVMEMYQLCVQHKYVLPSVYQGMYNALTRAVEPELFPCLRRLHIAFYAYNPLAGGMLTGRYSSYSDKPSTGERFSHGRTATMYSERYWKPELFTALDTLAATLQRVYGGKVTMTEASLRWMLHHSILKGGEGDGVILGASKQEQLEQNLRAVEGGPLDAEVVKVLDEAWQLCKANCQQYFR